MHSLFLMKIDFLKRFPCIRMQHSPDRQDEPYFIIESGLGINTSVTYANNGQEGLDALKADKFDIPDGPEHKYSDYCSYRRCYGNHQAYRH